MSPSACFSTCSSVTQGWPAERSGRSRVWEWAAVSSRQRLWYPASLSTSRVRWARSGSATVNSAPVIARSSSPTQDSANSREPQTPSWSVSASAG